MENGEWGRCNRLYRKNKKIGMSNAEIEDGEEDKEVLGI